MILPPRKYLAMSGVIFLLSQVRFECATSVQRAEGVGAAQHGSGQTPTTRVIQPELATSLVEKSRYRMVSVHRFKIFTHENAVVCLS